MKKFFGIILVLFFGVLQASAAYYPVELLDNIDISNLPAVVSVKVQKDIWLSDYHKIAQGSIIKGQVKKVVPPRRLERDAYISFVPVSIETVLENEISRIDLVSPSASKLRAPRRLSKRDVAANTIGTGLSMIPPFTFIVPVFQFAMGIVNPKVEEHPFKAGCRYLVESWPFCYFLKGKEVALSAGSVVELRITEKIFDSEHLVPETL